MLQSVSGVGIDAARVDRDTAVHQLSLCFERERFRVRRQDPPWKVVRAFALPESGALVHLHNVSGGVLAGDRLALDVEVEAGAAAQITTTGATRLYRHRAGAVDSEQHTRFSVGDGAVLEYLPDSVIPYAGSRHFQRTEIRLGAGATLFWWEALAPGRLAAGERFAFERLRVQTEVYAGARPVLREDFLLEPGAEGTCRRWRGCSSIRTWPACALFRKGGPPAFLASTRRPIKRNRTHADATGAGRLGRQHAGVGRRDGARLERERLLRAREANRILEGGASGDHRL